MGGHRATAATSTEDRLKAEALERFRRTGIRLDREGRFWHEGATIDHEGMRRAFFRWMDRLDDGRPILRLDENRYVYLDVDDAPLLVTSARWDGDRAFITTNDGAEQELAYDTLAVADDDAMYCHVRNRKLEARLTTPAFHTISERIEETENGFALRAAGARHSIGRRR
jgi:hypothetical protein